MAVYSPGSTIATVAAVYGPNNALQSADALPTASVLRNGVADASVVPTVAAIAPAGVYTITCAIPSSYLPGDGVTIMLSATVGGAPIFDLQEFQLVSWGVNSLPAAQPGASGGLPTINSSGNLAQDVDLAPGQIVNDGTGNATLTITTTANASVSLYSGSNLVAVSQANGSGVATVAAPAGTYNLTVTAAGMNGATESVTLVPGANSVTVTLSAIVVSSPSTPGLCRVVYVLSTPGGLPWTTANTSATPPAITLTLSALPAGSTGQVFDAAIVTVVPDATTGILEAIPGTGGVDLLQGAQYLVAAGQKSWTLSVPTTATATLGSLIAT